MGALKNAVSLALAMPLGHVHYALCDKGANLIRHFRKELDAYQPYVLFGIVAAQFLNSHV